MLHLKTQRYIVWLILLIHIFLEMGILLLYEKKDMFTNQKGYFLPWLKVKFDMEKNNVGNE